MIRLVFALLLTLAVLYGVSRIRRLPPKQRRQAWIRVGLWSLAIVLVLMTVTGRVHWIAAAVGMLLPLAKWGTSIGLSLWPMWRRRQAEQGKQAPSSNPDTLREAADTLGLKEPLERNELTRDKIIDAHRRLMQKLHPDRGGNDYLAARVNEAKEVLLKHLGA